MFTTIWFASILTKIQFVQPILFHITDFAIYYYGMAANKTNMVPAFNKYAAN